MSTRVTGLLTMAAAVSMTLTAGIAAAGTSLAAPPPSPHDEAPPPAASAEGQAAPAAEESKADADFRECADADCEVTIRDGQTIKLGEQYGGSTVRVKTEDQRVTFIIRGQDTRLTSTVDASPTSATTASYNGVTFRPRMNKDGSVNLKISHN
ncbi:hypothetical protein [Actinomadura monticuli]|uniref:DUF3060 domain-containing protein n=1 Tax=Actinomadura monticuli TaxID=3097367 RepID=A0ABV4Q915_9ACTN